MQNKPNLLDTQMTLSSVKTKYYENEYLRRRAKNEPNQTQSQTPPAFNAALAEYFPQIRKQPT
jgi:hypothetical protein